VHSPAVRTQAYGGIYIAASHGWLWVIERQRPILQPTVHPQLAGTERRPDFLVESDDGASFLLEAAVVSDESREETAARRQEDRIYDS
jgi:hypothetical protein